MDKAAIAEDATAARRQLSALANGYRAVKEQFKDIHDNKVEVIVKLLDLDDDLDGIASWLAGESQGDPSRLGRLIIHTLLALPGPLLEARRAVVTLGVDPLEVERLASSMQEARYSGVFKDLYDESRYWAAHLGYCSLPNDIQLARCKVCGEKASIICEIYKDCYDGFHSLGVIRVGAPARFESGRVCGYCLTSPLPDHLQIPTESKELIDTIITEAKSAGN